MTRFRIWQDRTGAGGWRFRDLTTDRTVYAGSYREAWARVEARLNIKQTRSTT